MIDILIAYLIMGAIGAKLLFIWFKTNAFVEYMSLIHPTKSIKEYKEVTVNDPSTSYPEYMAANHYDKFFVRLITCPKCLGVQIAVVLNFIALIILKMDLTAVLLLPLNVLVTAYFSLFMYFLLVIIYKKATI